MKIQVLGLCEQKLLLFVVLLNPSKTAGLNSNQNCLVIWVPFLYVPFFQNTLKVQDQAFMIALLDDPCKNCKRLLGWMVFFVERNWAPELVSF